MTFFITLFCFLFFWNCNSITIFLLSVSSLQILSYTFPIVHFWVITLRNLDLHFLYVLCLVLLSCPTFFLWLSLIHKHWYVLPCPVTVVLSHQSDAWHSIACLCLKSIWWISESVRVHKTHVSKYTKGVHMQNMTYFVKSFGRLLYNSMILLEALHILLILHEFMIYVKMHCFLTFTIVKYLKQDFQIKSCHNWIRWLHIFIS